MATKINLKVIALVHPAGKNQQMRLTRNRRGMLKPKVLSDTIHHNTDEGDSSDVNAEIHSPTEAKPSTSHAEENKYLSPEKGESNVNGDTASPNKAEMPETYIDKSIHPPTDADGSKNEDRDSKPGDSHVESSAIVPMEEKSDAGKGSVAILTTPKNSNMPGEGTDKNGSEAAKGYDPDVPLVSGVDEPVAPTHTKGITTEETSTDTIIVVVKPVIQPEPAMEKQNVPQKGEGTDQNGSETVKGYDPDVPVVSGIDEPVTLTHTKGITTEETTTDTMTLVVKPVIQPEPAVEKPNVPQKGEGTDKNGSEAVKGYDPDVRVVSGVDELVASNHTKGTTTEETKTDTITVVVKPVIQPEPAVEKPNVSQKGEGTDKNGSEAAKGFAPDVPVVPGVEGPMAPTHAKGITTEETTTDTMTMVVKPVVQPEPAVAKPNVPQKSEGSDKNGSETAKGYDPDDPVVSGVDELVAPTHTKGITTEETETDSITVVVKPLIHPKRAVEKPNVPQKGHKANHKIAAENLESSFIF
ncbi:nucleolar protein dao-5 [Ixodes scapularis]|uniref:nucleolar protein dao-5 n=1 Tax=Ixodes scapularis TaxID=6945 RepID=UPI001A9EE424|nr:nucleolar protein dao-5 [Ixodes scapularis]